MSFSEKVQTEALAASGRCCCICHKFCGTKIALHHIKQKAHGGDDSFENCIPLCLDCHEDMGKADPNHVTGKHYTEKELIMHRDAWYKKQSDSQRGNKCPVCEADKKLFNRICQSFSGELGERLRDDDLRGVHIRHSFNEVFKLRKELQSPLNEFLDADLEKLRAELIEKMCEFAWYLSTKTFPVGAELQQYQATHKWLYENGYILKREILPEEQDKLVQEFETEADQLNESATNLWESYCEFVRQGRRIINR